MKCDYPAEAPVEEIGQLFKFFTGDQSIDMCCAVKCGWWVLGYGLSLGIPCESQLLQIMSKESLHMAMAYHMKPMTESAGPEGMGKIEWKALIALLLKWLPIIIPLIEPKVDPVAGQ